MTTPTPHEPRAEAEPTARDLVLRCYQRAFLGWLFVYMLLGRWLQGEGGFFGRTADRVDSPWLLWTFLNIPLQFLLTLAVMYCAASKRERVQTAGIWIGSCNGILVIGHIVLSVITA